MSDNVEKRSETDIRVHTYKIHREVGRAKDFSAPLYWGSIYLLFSALLLVLYLVSVVISGIIGVVFG